MNRIRRGFVAVPNPNNATRPSWRSLKPEAVEAIVFWTKDARPLLPHLPELRERGYCYYFQYSLTRYPNWLEPRTPKGQDAIDAFWSASRAVGLGPDTVVWRYDPIFFLPDLDEDWHYEKFGEIASALRGATHRCVISFLDVFRKTAGNLKKAWQAEGSGSLDEHLRVRPDDMRAFGDRIGRIAEACDMEVVTCAEPTDVVEKLGPRVSAGRCIDVELLTTAGARKPSEAKDQGQREGCGCVVSRDIGMYDSCLHGCAYCYATASRDAADRNQRTRHYPDSASLLGRVADSDCPPRKATHAKPKSGGLKPAPTNSPTTKPKPAKPRKSRRQDESLF